MIEYACHTHIACAGPYQPNIGRTMSQNLYDSTGVLELSAVTPLIRALFKGFGLDEHHPGDGQVFISRMSENSPPSWQDILEELRDLAESLDIDVPLGDEWFAGEYLQVIARHYGADSDPVLARLLATYQFTDAADLDTVYRVAERIDDGHGLKAMKIEGCWHSDRPRLFEFGGDCSYYSRQVKLESNTTNAVEFGAKLNSALVAGDAAAASAHIQSEFNKIVASIQDDQMRGQVSDLLRVAMMQQLSTSTLAEAIRHRGHTVSVWSGLDAISAIEADIDTSDLSEDQIERLAYSLMERGSKQLLDDVANQGNASLAQLWIECKDQLLEDVRAGESESSQP